MTVPNRWKTRNLPALPALSGLSSVVARDALGITAHLLVRTPAALIFRSLSDPRAIVVAAFSAVAYRTDRRVVPPATEGASA